MELGRLLEIALGNAAFALLLTVAVALVGLWLRRPAVLHVLWLVVLARLLAPPVLEVALLPAAAPIATIGPVAAVPAAVEVPSAPGPGLEVTFGFDLQGALLLAWLVGSAALLVLAAVRTLRLVRCIRTGSSPPGTLRDRVAGLAREMAVRPPELRLVTGQLPPMVWGLPSRPILVLPERLVPGLGPDELDAVIAHELAHLRRRDHWVRWLELAAVVLFWWNPASWWASGGLRAAEEECCDALVAARLPGSSASYARGLVKTMGFLAGADTFFPTVVTGASHFRTLERRIRVIMSGGFARSVSAPLWAALAVLVVATLVIAPTLAARGASDERDGLESPTSFTGKPITLSLDQAVVRDVLRSFSAIAGVNVLIDDRVTVGALNTRVSGEFVDTPWDRVLDTLLRQADLAWSRSDSVLWIHMRGLPPPKREEFTGEPITLSLEDADLRAVLGMIEKITGARFELGPEVQGKVTVELVDLPWDQALDLILKVNGFTWALEDGVYRVARGDRAGGAPLLAELPDDPERPASLVDGERIRRFVRGGPVTEPVRLHTPPAPYTKEARDARIEGVVVLQTLIDTDGRVVRAESVSGLPLGLTESALETVRGWRFEPATLDGEPVVVEYVVAVRFRLVE